jgi:hypothetical protein
MSNDGHPMTPENMILSVSKDVEALAKTMQDSILLFRENQAMLNRVLADMQEHKAVDSRIHADFIIMQAHVFGTPADAGLTTKVHELQSKVGSLWKLFWAVVTAAVTGGGALAYFK